MNTIFGLLLLASLVFLIIGLINPNLSLFWFKKQKTRAASSIIFGVSLVISFILFTLTTATSTKTASSTTAEVPIVEEKKQEKSWQTVYTFKGNGEKKSATFELTGAEARIKYKYNNDERVNIGVFAVFIVDEGKDLMAEGGFPEIMTSEPNEESESSIQKSAGRYYMSVKAAGKWTAVIEEFK